VSGDAYVSGGLRVTKQGVVIVIVLADPGRGLGAVLQPHQDGTAIIAVSQEPTATSLVGISVNRVSALTWGLAGLLGGIGGVPVRRNVGRPRALGILTGIALIPRSPPPVFGGHHQPARRLPRRVVDRHHPSARRRNIPESVVPLGEPGRRCSASAAGAARRPLACLGKET
jgi:hypothetical protein